MLKLTALLALLCVVCKGESDIVISPPGALTVKQKLEKVVMPALSDDGLLQSVDKTKCLDKKIYDNTDELLAVHDEQGYLCAYIAFQANKKQGVGIPMYSNKKEATDRYVCFKETVDEVNKINGGHLSYTAGINKFADMTPYERSMSLGYGIRTKEEIEAIPKHCGGSTSEDDSNKIASSSEADEGGMPALGSAMNLGSAPIMGAGLEAPPGDDDDTLPPLGMAGPPAGEELPPLGMGAPRGGRLGMGAPPHPRAP